MSLALTNRLRYLSSVFLKNAVVQSRFFFTSRIRYGKRNFRKFQIPNVRGNAMDKEWLKMHPEAYDHRGRRPHGIRDGYDIIPIKELTPELIVPDLTDFKLKPYVSYRVPDVVQDKFTAEDLFNAIYSKKIIRDFRGNKLDDEGNPLEYSENETMSPEMASQKARQCGSDIYG